MDIINYDLKIKRYKNNIKIYIILITFGLLLVFIPSNTYIKIIILLFILYFLMGIIKNSNDLSEYEKDNWNEYYEYWNEYYFRKNTESRQKAYEQYERIKNEYSEKQKKYYNNYYGQYDNAYDQNGRYKSTNKTISITEKISNAFKLLKLNPSDTEKIIKARYRELAIKWHPDKWITDTMENQKIAERNFKKLCNAYDIIKEYKNIK